MTPYGPVAIYLLVAFIAAFLFCFVPGLLAHKKPNPVKSEAYECGVEPTSDVSGRFPVRFYLIAMLFVDLRRRGRIVLSVGGADAPAARLRSDRDGVVRRRARDRIRVRVATGGFQWR